MIVVREHSAKAFLQVGKINDHAALNLSLDSDFDLISVAVQGSARRVARQEMSAVDVIAHTKPHGVRITWANDPLSLEEARVRVQELTKPAPSSFPEASPVS